MSIAARAALRLVSSSVGINAPAIMRVDHSSNSFIPIGRGRNSSIWVKITPLGVSALLFRVGKQVTLIAAAKSANASAQKTVIMFVTQAEEPLQVPRPLKARLGGLILRHSALKVF